MMVQTTDNGTQTRSAPMMGEVVEGAATPAALATALSNAGADPDFFVSVEETARQFGMAPDAFARLAVRRFCERAEDDEWLQVMGVMGRSEMPGAAGLAHILRKAVSDAAEVLP